MWRSSSRPETTVVTPATPTKSMRQPTKGTGTTPMVEPKAMPLPSPQTASLTTDRVAHKETDHRSAQAPAAQPHMLPIRWQAARESAPKRNELWRVRAVNTKAAKEASIIRLRPSDPTAGRKRASRLRTGPCKPGVRDRSFPQKRRTLPPAARSAVRRCRPGRK